MVPMKKIQSFVLQVNGKIMSTFDNQEDAIDASGFKCYLPLSQKDFNTIVLAEVNSYVGFDYTGNTAYIFRHED